LLTTGVLLSWSVAHADDKAAELAKALQKTAALDSYTFTVEEGGPGAGGRPGLEAKYQKDQPLWCKAENRELFKKGDVLVYKDGNDWVRSRTGTLSDPLRVLGAVAKVRKVRVPHEELAGFEKHFKDVKAAGKDKDGNLEYSGDLTDEAVKKLVPTEFRQVARSGTAKVWVNSGGMVVKYTVAITVKGRLGNAEVEGMPTRTVMIRDGGKTKVEVPEAAKKALE
jgi:hypothetical protein